MKLYWSCCLGFLALIAGCAAPRPGGSLADKVEGRSVVYGEDPAGLQAELRDFLVSSEHGAKLAATVAAVKTACEAVLWNIENAETVGFKRVVLRLRNGELESSVRSFDQGYFDETGEALDLAIEGPGFFELELPDGTKGYTRDGAFQLRFDGRLVSGKGHALARMEPLPFRSGTIHIAPDGTVKQVSATGVATANIRVMDFVNPAGLDLNREGLFIETATSGGAKGVELAGNSVPRRCVMQGCLELANVHVVEEIASLMRLLQWKRSVRELVSAVNPD